MGLHQLAAAHEDPVSGDLGLHAGADRVPLGPELGGELIDPFEGGGAPHGRRDRVLVARLGRCGEGEDLLPGATSEREHLQHLGLAERERPGLVEDDGVRARKPLEVLPALDEHPVIGRHGQRRERRGRDGDANAAAEVGDENARQPVEVARQDPRAQAEGDGGHDEPVRRRLRGALERHGLGARRLEHPDDPRRVRVRAGALDLDDDLSVDDDGGRVHAFTRAPRARERFARERLLVDRRHAIDDDPVGPDPLARVHDDALARLELPDGDLLGAARGSKAPGVTRLEMRARRHRASRPVGGALENEVAGAQQPRDERRGARLSRRQRDSDRADVERVDRQAPLGEGASRTADDGDGRGADRGGEDHRVQAACGRGHQHQSVERGLRPGARRSRRAARPRRGERVGVACDQLLQVERRQLRPLVGDDDRPRSRRSLDAEDASVVAERGGETERELRRAVDHAEARAARDPVDGDEARATRRGPAEDRSPVPERCLRWERRARRASSTSRSSRRPPARALHVPEVNVAETRALRVPEVNVAEEGVGPVKEAVPARPPRPAAEHERRTAPSPSANETTP